MAIKHEVSVYRLDKFQFRRCSCLFFLIFLVLLSVFDARVDPVDESYCSEYVDANDNDDKSLVALVKKVFVSFCRS